MSSATVPSAATSSATGPGVVRRPGERRQVRQRAAVGRDARDPGVADGDQDGRAVGRDRDRRHARGAGQGDRGAERGGAAREDRGARRSRSGAPGVGGALWKATAAVAAGRGGEAEAADRAVVDGRRRGRPGRVGRDREEVRGRRALRAGRPGDRGAAVGERDGAHLADAGAERAERDRRAPGAVRARGDGLDPVGGGHDRQPAAVGPRDDGPAPSGSRAGARAWGRRCRRPRRAGCRSWRRGPARGRRAAARRRARRGRSWARRPWGRRSRRTRRRRRRFRAALHPAARR